MTPEIAALTPDGFLDNLARTPQVYALVHAVVTGPPSTSVTFFTPTSRIIKQIFQDVPLEIDSVVAVHPGPVTYRPGVPAFLRIPGGTARNVTYVDDAMPPPPSGSEVFVLVRDHAGEFGGNAPGYMIASIEGQDVFRVNSGIVTVRGAKEPRDQFAAHFSDIQP